jgi:hypothetical protein
MIRSSFAPRAATRSYYFAAVLCVIAFAIPVRIASAQGPRIRPGRYKIQNAASDKFMDIDGNDGTIHQWEFGNQKSQLWDIEMGGNGYVYIRSAENGMLLDIAGGAPRDEARLMLAPQNGSQNQLWMIEDAGEGLFRITSRFGKCIDVPDASRANGVGWQLWRPIEKYAEKFRFSLVADAPAGNRDRDHRDRDNDGEARGEKGAYHQGYSFGVQDARAHLRSCWGQRINTIPISRTLSSRAITMATTAVEPISAKCSRPTNRATTRATVLGAKIIRREGTRITRGTWIVLTIALRLISGEATRTDFPLHDSSWNRRA